MSGNLKNFRLMLAMLTAGLFLVAQAYSTIGHAAQRALTDSEQAATDANGQPAPGALPATLSPVKQPGEMNEPLPEPELTAADTAPEQTKEPLSAMPSLAGQPGDAPDKLPDSQASAENDNAPAQGMSPTEQLDDAQARFLSFYADELYSQAATAANQTVLLASQIYGPESLETALALGNLATVQRQTGDLQTARSNYQLSIKLVEDNEGIVSPRLINPLMGLAATQNMLGAYDLGLKTYKRALRINHVDLGLDNLEQLEIRDGLTESYLGLGDFEEADFQQEVQLRIVREEYPEDLQKLTAAMYKLGDWYRRSNQPEKETLHMQDSLRAIRKAAGDDSIEEITALRGLASAYQRLDMPSEALRVLKQAWRVNEKNPTTDILLGAEIEVELGDLYNAYGDTRNARRAYTGAWQTLTKANAADEVYERYFGSPTNIWRVELPDVYPSSSKTRKLFVEDPDQFRNGLVVAEFDIDENGRVKNILIVESDPPNLIDKKISYLLGRYFYRPRFANGVPVQTGGQRIRHNFSYLPQDKPTKKDKPLENGSSEGKLEYPGAGT